MAGRKKLKLDRFILSTQKINKKNLYAVKGGYNFVSGGAGSTGLIDWSEIDIRSSNPANGDIPEIRDIKGGILF